MGKLGEAKFDKRGSKESKGSRNSRGSKDNPLKPSNTNLIE
jgi:hypothetical protein